MIILPNGCKCSNLTVHPSDWKTSKAKLKSIWYITYRFYDPTVIDSNGKIKPKQIQIKGMNECQSLKDKQFVTQSLLESEMDLLTKGYNPITKACLPEDEVQYEIDPSTPFIKALNAAKERMQLSKSSAKDIRLCINACDVAAKQLRYEQIQIKDIKRKHIRFILDRCAKLNPKFSANTFNHYRSYLMMLFKELLELEAVDGNPVRDIAKKKTVKKIREVLSTEERQKVDKHLFANHYTFWRLVQVFFHSGARETEILRVMAKDVQLDQQRFKVTINKGKQSQEVWRTIKTIALPIWQELLSESKPEHYLFSKGLIPGDVSITSHQITKRWRIHVKQKLGISADFYALKHLNLDETAAVLDIEAATKMAGHKSTVITMKHYTVNETSRQHDRLKEVANKFA